jgi:hypothetical protein
MLFCREYNTLAWWLIKQYGLTRKWAMKIAYLLIGLGKGPGIYKYKPGSPLLTIWDPANVMKVICIMRSQIRRLPEGDKSSSLTLFCDLVYSKYRSLQGVGAEFISRFGEGEVLYWATVLYVESLAAKEKGGLRYIALDLPEGESISNPWFHS